MYTILNDLFVTLVCTLKQVKVFFFFFLLLMGVLGVGRKKKSLHMRRTKAHRLPCDRI